MDKEELNKILENHRLWVNGEGGECADLQAADLKYANLKFAHLQAAYLQGAELNGADLQNANIDYSCWPLWCGSLGVIVDARIARQLMYHALAVLCDDPEFMEIRNDPKVLAFVNKFHRVEMGDCQELKPIEQKKGKRNMRKFEFYVATYKVGSEMKSIVEFDDDISDEEIEEEYKGWMWENLATYWEEIE